MNESDNQNTNVDAAPIATTAINLQKFQALQDWVSTHLKRCLQLIRSLPAQLQTKALAIHAPTVDKDFWLYIIMFAASTVVGYSFASLAIRSLAPFLSQLSSYRQLATKLAFLGAVITGMLNTLLYWDFETLEDLISNKDFSYTWQGLFISLLSGFFEAFTMLMSYPRSLSLETRLLFGSLYFVTATTLYLVDNKNLDLETFLSKENRDQYTLNAAWKFITQRTFYFVMISINLYGTYLMSTALTSDLILATQQLSGILGATSLLIVNNTLHLLRGLYTFANSQFYLAKADFVANDYESDVKPYLATPYAMGVLSLTVANALINGFINTLNSAINPMTLFNITVSAMMSCSAMLNNFFKHTLVPDSFQSSQQNGVEYDEAYYQLPSFYQLIPNTTTKSAGISAIAVLWSTVIATPSLIGCAGIGVISFIVIDSLKRSAQQKISLRRKVSEEITPSMIKTDNLKVLPGVYIKRNLNSNERKAQEEMNNEPVVFRQVN